MCTSKNKLEDGSEQIFLNFLSLSCQSVLQGLKW